MKNNTSNQTRSETKKGRWYAGQKKKGDSRDKTQTSRFEAPQAQTKRLNKEAAQ